MNKFCITYRKSVSRELALSSLQANCITIRNGEASYDMLKKVCGNLTYLSLFLIADYTLEDRVQYSIENVCLSTPGLLKLPMHNLLECCGNITYKSDELINSLKYILHDCMFAEIMSLLGVGIKNTYCALFCCLAELMQNKELKDNVLFLWNDNTKYIHDIWTYFEREVMET